MTTMAAMSAARFTAGRNNMRVVFMGTPDFAAASLKKLIDEKYEVVGVLTQPDKPRGRGMSL